MDYRCTLCGKASRELLVYIEHTEQHVVDLIKHDHPDWTEKDGMCNKCLDYYRAELQGSPFKDAACALRRRKVKSVWQAIKGFLEKK